MPVPPPEFLLYISPGSLILRPGDEKVVNLFVNSTTNLQSFKNVSVSIGYSNFTSNNSEIILNIIPNNASLPTYGFLNSKLHVKVLSNAINTMHMIPLHINISFPSLQRNNTDFNFNTYSLFTITVLPPKDINDYIKDLADWVSPLNSIWTFIAAIGVVIVPLVLKIYSKRTKRNNIVDYY